MSAPTIDPQALTPIELGTPQGGVWHDAILGWTYTCRMQGCRHWAGDYGDAEHAAVGLRVHERQQCPARPQRRASDYERDDPETTGVLPDGVALADVDLVPVGAGPGRCVPAAALRGAA